MDTHLFGAHLLLQLGEAAGVVLLAVGHARHRRVAAVQAELGVLRGPAPWRAQVHRLVGHLGEPHLKHVLGGGVTPVDNQNDNVKIDI